LAAPKVVVLRGNTSHRTQFQILPTTALTLLQMLRFYDILAGLLFFDCFLFEKRYDRVFVGSLTLFFHQKLQIVFVKYNPFGAMFIFT